MKPNIPPVLITFALVCFALVQNTQAVSPPPDGGYPGGNTAEGQNALLSLTSGSYNTAVGFLSITGNTTGSFNTGVGAGTLLSNTGDQNTAIGAGALLVNVIGSQNTANGAFALFHNGFGTKNTATGANTLFNNIVGNFNTATGADALSSNTEGFGNTAMGLSALESNLDGANNTAVGNGALLFCTGGGINTALGAGAGSGVTSADNVICIGANVAGANVSNTTWIGSVYGVATQTGTTAPVIVSSTGQLGTVVSSERFKKDIAAMEKASEVVLSLKPVTFHYKSDTTATPQFGLIAEEVAKVDPALVLPDSGGKPYTVRYDAMNAMLLNEFLKEHRKNEEQQATIAQLKFGMEALTATVKEQAAQIQKVSAQLEASKPTPQVVLNN